ncbi:AGAP007799-PA [Anopheles gambiae str. PEST]|uniref:Cilia- and flagella-associated protein 251 n=1 Tax=Anopheles gambiae TaxID=7165 RepID=Q5TQ19_ANOGA|nr:AGAP007799-PA [Anopheles gambiae str. PEST]
MSELVEYNPVEEVQHDEHIHHRCHPLHLTWVSGFNPRVSLLNVSTSRDRKELVLASGNALLFYCYDGEREKITPVIGHKNVVNMIGCDESGRFVVSSDCSYCINVWDRQAGGGESHHHPIAIRTIFEPFKANGDIGAVSLSCDGKYLLAGGGIPNEQGSQLKLWSWTVGNDFPDDSITLPTRLGRIKAIHFCPDRGRRNQFVVTLDSGVVFGAWDCKEQKLSIQVPKRHGFQDYNDTVFVERTDRAVSVTGAGMAVLWNNDRKFSDAQEGGVQRKEFLKYLHLKYASINVVRSCDEKIVTGDDDGEIRFYDNSMKILYWFKQEDLEPIRTLSFELVETRRWKQPAEPIEGDEQTPKEESTEKKVVLNIEDIAPKDVSFDARPVIVRGFVSATKSGKIYDIDIVYNKIQELFLQSPSIITAFDVHSARSELCTCDGNGRFVVYDLKTKSMRLALDVPIQRTRRGRITTLAYSPCGTFLAGGAENGFLWMVEPNLMILAGSSPLQFTSEKIRLDESNTITLLHREKDDWQVMGNCATHRLVDLAFLSATDFVSIGEDRQLPGEDYFLFITNNNIYVHHLPIDGNPFKYLAVRGHPKRLKALQVAWTVRCAFTFGEGDHAVSMWKINTSPLYDNLKHAGTGLDPFCTLLPGGKRGCYVREILSLFFYNQISPKNSDGDAELTLRDAMNVQDVPNYLRSIGFHMSEYEEQNLCKEMELTGTYFLTFEEVLKLFLNHRTAAGGPPTSEDVRTAVTYVGATTSSGKVDLVRLITLLASMGEPMEPKTTEAYCRILFPAAFEANEQDGSPAPECGTGEDCTNYIAIDEFADRLC